MTGGRSVTLCNLNETSGAKFEYKFLVLIRQKNEQRTMYINQEMVSTKPVEDSIIYGILTTEPTTKSNHYSIKHSF